MLIQPISSRMRFFFFRGIVSSTQLFDSAFFGLHVHFGSFILTNSMLHQHCRDISTGRCDLPHCQEVAWQVSSQYLFCWMRMWQEPP